jgi:hypothetical protein
MKKVALIPFVLIGTLFVLVAYAKPSHPPTYLEGTVVHVERHEATEKLAGGENPSDAPLPDPEVFAYDIALHVNCGTYVGRYQSWYDHVPSVFRVDQKVQLRLTRSVMYVTVPNEKDAQLNIVSKHIEHGPCEAANRDVASR